MLQRNGRAQRRATFFGKLACDKRGNTLAMMAIALIPLSAMAGSAVDMGRLYLVKVRLQQACDAGVLAGRKTMLDPGTTLDANATTQAKTFFANNFPSGLMGTAGFSSTTNPYPFVPTRTADNRVAGTASVTVPMSIMKMFNAGDTRLTVTCEARYDVADTDVMFVIDTTGSMACEPSDSSSDCSAYVNSAGTETYTRPADGTTSGNKSVPGYPGSTSYYVKESADSRIKAVRLAVLSFYDTMAASIDPTKTFVRYGFVTYTSTVNAGRAILDLNRNYMIGGNGSANWSYQSRRANGSATRVDTDTQYLSSSACSALVIGSRTPSSGYREKNDDDNNDYEGPRALKRATSRNSRTGVCTIETTTYLPKWTYAKYDYDVGAYVAGGAVNDPTKAISATARWTGCIEERDTTAGATSFAMNALPADLNPDLVPSSPATRWRPMWPEIIYDRYYNPDATDGDDSTYRPWAGSTSRQRSGYVSCGKPVSRLATMTKAQVSAYVNAGDFRALGGTYHDVGMIWGLRMLSPSGVFAADTAAQGTHPAPYRVLVFMTDGDMSPNEGIYGLYGLEKWDQRVTDGSYGNLADYKEYHNARFLAACSKAKELKIDVWVVAVGQAVTQQLKDCASAESQAIYAGTSPDVSAAFSKIAKQVAALRVSR